ncbi:hypothetical protein COBT_001341 [Conglomerata obtusa]
MQLCFEDFNCLMYSKIKEICQFYNVEAEHKRKEFFHKNENNRIMIFKILDKSEKSAKIIINYLQKLMDSYSSKKIHTGKFNNYCVKESNKTDEDIPALDLNLFFRSIFFLSQQKEGYNKDFKICENYTINLSKNLDFPCKSLIDKYFDSKNKISIIENFLESEEQLALLYAIISDMYGLKIPLTNCTYLILSLKFKDEKQNESWFNGNFASKKNVTRLILIQ